ncbi:hypothetical protein [Kamptonema formosum]|uniref:hypothetical protein n=1 Tax=Kamptonema formosum TaxID=331992 RepID=UPI00034A40E8|nr:hypothetical protein [Oscillatoria sp. PCC 10802]
MLPPPNGALIHLSADMGSPANLTTGRLSRRLSGPKIFLPKWQHAHLLLGHNWS